MLEEMRNARLAHRLIGGAGLVIDHVGHDRRAMKGNNDDLHAVAEREGGDILDDQARPIPAPRRTSPDQIRYGSNLRIEDIRDLMLARRASLNRAWARRVTELSVIRGRPQSSLNISPMFQMVPYFGSAARLAAASALRSSSLRTPTGLACLGIGLGNTVARIGIVEVGGFAPRPARRVVAVVAVASAAAVLTGFGGGDGIHRCRRHGLVDYGFLGIIRGGGKRKRSGWLLLTAFALLGVPYSEPRQSAASTGGRRHGKRLVDTDLALVGSALADAERCRQTAFRAGPKPGARQTQASSLISFMIVPIPSFPLDY